MIRANLLRRVIANQGGLLLDSYPGATAAFCTHLLRKTYTGPLIRIRRSSDNAEKDFYPDDNDELSLNSEDGSGTILGTWISTDNGFVTILYDQSENGNNGLQATDSFQPQIISTGSLIVDNGKPTLEFDGSDDFLQTNAFSVVNQPTSWFLASRLQSVRPQMFFDGISNRQTLFVSGGSNVLSIFSGTTLSSSTTPDLNEHLYSVFFNTTDEIFYDGNSIADGNSGSQGMSQIVIGANNSKSTPLRGRIKLLILYNSDQTSNRINIESEINNYFNIY